MLLGQAVLLWQTSFALPSCLIWQTSVTCHGDWCCSKPALLGQAVWCCGKPVLPGLAVGCCGKPVLPGLAVGCCGKQVLLCQAVWCWGKPALVDLAVGCCGTPVLLCQAVQCCGKPVCVFIFKRIPVSLFVVQELGVASWWGQMALWFICVVQESTAPAWW